MPSTTALGAINAPNTSEIFLTLITLSHELLEEDLHFVNDFQNCVSNGITYIAWPFDLPFPEVGSDTLPTLTLSIDNVDISISQAIAKITTPIDVQIMCVLASNPDVIEVGPLYMRMRSTQITLGKINSSMTFEDLLNEPFPFNTYNPGNAPGLF